MPRRDKQKSNFLQQMAFGRENFSLIRPLSTHTDAIRTKNAKNLTARRKLCNQRPLLYLAYHEVWLVPGLNLCK